MPFEDEQRQANALDRALADDLARHLPDATVTLNGSGVHWDCVATRGHRTCKIPSFARERPEYLVYFNEYNDRIAEGRTPSLAHAVRAIRDWLAGRPLTHLYANYLFVDGPRRQLSALACEVTARRTELTRAATCKLTSVLGNPELSFRATDRKCHVFSTGFPHVPYASFTADGFPILLFDVRDPRPFADLLARWFYDRAAPSAIAAEFRTVRLSEVAPFYEEGRPLEGEFIVSWRHVEAFYRELATQDHQQAATMLPLIDQIRAAGLDQTLRAGQSMDVLIVSRSRRHGLRPGQPSAAFILREDGRMTVQSNFDAREKLTLARPELTPEVHSLLERLEAQPID